MQANESEYADTEGRAYEYPRYIPQTKRVAVGDILFVALPKASAPDCRRILGLARVRSIQGRCTERLVASYDRYRKPSKSATFEEIGDDPRKNQTNSINPIDPEIAKKLFEREGVADVESLPIVASEPTRREPPPSDHGPRELLRDAVVKDLLGPASEPDEEILGASVRDRYLVGKLAPKEARIDQAYTGDLAESVSDTEECAALAMHYRDEVKFAVGHGVSEHWKRSAGCVDRAISVRTQVVPWYDVPVTTAPASARKASKPRTNG